MADDTVTVEAPVFQGPALSATTDVPEVTKPADPPPVDVEVNKAVETKIEDAPAEVESETTETGTEKSGPEKTTADAGKEKQDIPPYAKREITIARNQKREAEARATAAERLASESAARLDTALKALENAGAKPKVSVETPRPKREAFDNPDAYDEALVTWAADNAARMTEEKVTAAEAKRSETARKATEDAEQRRLQADRAQSWNAKQAEFVKSHPDFEDVVGNDDLLISQAMTDILAEADNGPELAYALGKDPDLSAKIAQLSPGKAALEMGKFAASVEAARKPKVSKAPPPVRPVGSRADAGKKSADEMSMDEYAAMRTPQIIAERLGPQARARAN